jgi:hypothetical protein
VLKDDDRRNEAEGVLETIGKYGLYSRLQPGTITRDHQTGRPCSTVDVILATAMLGEYITRCGIYTVDHATGCESVDRRLLYGWLARNYR